MKKLLIIPLLIIAGFLTSTYINLFKGQATYQQSLASTDYTVLSLDNLDKTNINIIIGSGNEIELDLKGSEEDLNEIKAESDDIFSQFGFSDKWKNISGTITVPEGTLIEVNLSEETDVLIEDVKGKNSFSDKTSLVIDTNGLDSISVTQAEDNRESDKAILTIKDWGDSVVLDAENWDLISENTNTSNASNSANQNPLEDTNISEEEPDSQTSSEENNDENEVNVIGNPNYCGFGPQSIRDYCCSIVNSHKTIECNGLGYWVFSNSLDECIPACDQNPPENNLPPSEESNNNESENEENNNTSSEENQTSNGQAETVFYDDPTSQVCADSSSESSERNNCCNNSLKNNLSTGPRPGFPDCIGEWYFDNKEGCSFECAEHTRMLEILNELKQNAQTQ